MNLIGIWLVKTYPFLSTGRLPLPYGGFPVLGLGLGGRRAQSRLNRGRSTGLLGYNYKGNHFNNKKK